jgi:hypothetical protein
MGYLDNIPHAMRGRKQWMLAGPDKAPQAVDFANESTYAGAKNNPSQWMEYDQARFWAMELGMYMGYVPLPDDPFSIIDLDWKDDKVYDVDANEIKIGLYNAAIGTTYVERSLSGKGAHIIIEGKLPNDFNAQTAGIECYGNKGFVVITGRMESASNEITKQQGWLDYLVAKYPRSVDDAQFADSKLDPEQVNNASAEELALDNKFAEWTDGWANRATIDGWMNDNPGDDRSQIDLKVMQLFVKFTRNRKYPDESAVRMFMHCPRSRLLGRKSDPRQYVHRTLVSAKARVAMDEKRAKDSDFRGAADKMLADKLQAAIPAQGAPIANSPVPPVAASNRFNTKTAKEVLQEPAIEWAVQDLFQSHAVNAIYGWSGVGKSFIALDMAAAVADGVEWFGYKTLKMPVLYVAIEGGNALNQRLGAFEKGNGHEYPENVEFYRGRFKLTDVELITDFILARKQSGWTGGMIIIDTFAKAIVGSDENSATDMGKAVEALELLKEQLNACVVIVHHSTKPDPKTGIAGSMRGSGSLQAGIEGVFEVAKLAITDPDNEDRVIGYQRFVRANKVKEGDDKGFHNFELSKVMLDRFDNFGTQLSSCYIQPEREMVNSPVAPIASNTPTYDYSTSTSHQPTRPPFGGARSKKQAGNRQAPLGGGKNQRAILDAIVNDCAKAGNHNVGSHGAPPGIPCSPADAVVEEAMRARPDAGDPTQLKRDLKKVLKDMVDAGKLGSKNEENSGKWIQWVWALG